MQDINHYQRFEPNLLGRDIICGDVHGHYGRLMRALISIRFDTGKDRLFLTGDVIDRGPESWQMLILLEEDWAFSVQGNHERYAANHETGNPSRWVEYGGAWFYQLGELQKMVASESCRALPYAIEIERANGASFGIVHADVPYSDWGKIRDGNFTPSVVRHLTGSRGRFDSASQQWVSGIDGIFVGHCPTIHPVLLGNVWHIDTYAWEPYGTVTFAILGDSLDDVKLISVTGDHTYESFRRNKAPGT